MADMDGLMGWIVRACVTVIAACDKVAATTAFVRETAEAMRLAAVAVRNQHHVDEPIPDDWEQVPGPGGAAQAQRQPPAADHSGSDDADDTNSCVICMEPYEAGGDGRSVLTACGHRFHRGCFAAWLRRNRTCPLCRAPIDESAPPPAAARTAGVAV
jgi:hypothetical protein